MPRAHRSIRTYTWDGVWPEGHGTGHQEVEEDAQGPQVNRGPNVVIILQFKGTVSWDLEGNTLAKMALSNRKFRLTKPIFWKHCPLIWSYIIQNNNNSEELSEKNRTIFCIAACSWFYFFNSPTIFLNIYFLVSFFLHFFFLLDYFSFIFLRCRTLLSLRFLIKNTCYVNNQISHIYA